MMKAAKQPDKEEFLTIFRAATNSKTRSPSTIQALKTMLDDHEDLELWRHIGSAMRLAETGAYGDEMQQGVIEVWDRRSAALKDELGINDSPKVEQLLIQQIALCWLRLSLIEASYSRMSHISTPPAIVLFWEKRLSLVQRRFTRAGESLAMVRKLTRGNLQVNIAAQGGQQINVA